jgi:hypothetical protein
MSDGPPALEPRHAWSLCSDGVLIRWRDLAALWPLGLAAMLRLAYATGANGVSKAIAPLVGGA